MSRNQPRPDIRQQPPPARPVPARDQLPRTPKAYRPRTGLPVGGYYVYRGPSPMPGVTPKDSTGGAEAMDPRSPVAAALNAGGYECPFCHAVAAVTPARTVRPSHKPRCPRGKTVRSFLERAS